MESEGASGDGVHSKLYRALRAHLRQPIKGALRRVMPDAVRRSRGARALLRRYERTFGRALDLHSPQCFTERLFVQMIHTLEHGDPLRTRLADKLRVRDFVAERIGRDYLVPLLWYGRRPAAIPFAQLPAAFVVKPNHGSGWVTKVDGAYAARDIVKQAKRWLATNFYWHGCEGQYYGIEREILVEPYLKHAGCDPFIYRIWSFNGIAEIVQVDDGEDDVMSFYDRNWRRLDL